MPLRLVAAVMRRKELRRACDTDERACVVTTPALAAMFGAFARMRVSENDDASVRRNGQTHEVKDGYM